MKKFKWISLILSATVVFISILGCSSKPKTYTHGDWVIMHQGENECLLYDLTEQGREKEVLIFPTEVAGRKVVGVYYEPTGFMVAGHQITAPNLKRLYFTEYVKIDNGAIITSKEKNVKVILNYMFDTENEKIYCPSLIYGAEFYSNIQNIDILKNIQGNYYAIDLDTANITYYCNYNDIIPYWVDDYDNETIKYPPIAPVRDGYEFAGWYKEPECINKWNFETDIVPAKEYNPDLQPSDGYYQKKAKYVYKETALYAKWVKI